MLLAGDVGGTKTLMGVFVASAKRPTPVDIRSYVTREFADLGTLVARYLLDLKLDARRIEVASFGVAGPVEKGRARLTNVDWSVDLGSVHAHLPGARAYLLNDLEALAWAVSVLQPDEVEVLQEGHEGDAGPAALLAAGTGLGVALLPRTSHGLLPQASEGGHVDFAARTQAEQRLQSALVDRFGRAELEHVVSGPGLANIHTALHPHTCETLAAASTLSSLPALISTAALTAGCPECRRTLEVFVSAYGAAAGNLALTALPFGGLYLGGGIAPQIIEALRWPMFLEAFRSKAPMEGVMRRIPVKVILNRNAGLLGAAHYIGRTAT
jgi:glucokinase